MRIYLWLWTVSQVLLNSPSHLCAKVLSYRRQYGIVRIFKRFFVQSVYFFQVIHHLLIVIRLNELIPSIQIQKVLFIFQVPLYRSQLCVIKLVQVQDSQRVWISWCQFCSKIENEVEWSDEIYQSSLRTGGFNSAVVDLWSFHYWLHQHLNLRTHLVKNRM